MKQNNRFGMFAFTVCVALLGYMLLKEGNAQSSSTRHPVQLTAATTDNGNYLLYRMWSDGSIDVRLVNPMRTQADDWPNSNKAGLSFQEGWKLFQQGQ